MTKDKGGFVGISLDLGMCVFTGSDQDGYPLAQHDAHGENAGVGSSELHHTFGFAARPRDPDTDAKGKPIEGKGCNLLIGSHGNELHYWLAYDPRFIPLVPPLKKGGAAFYCATGSFQVFDGDDGTSTLYVPVPGNKAHVFTVGIDGNAKPWIGLEHSNGMSVSMLEKSVTIKNAAGDVYLELNDSGVVVNGNTILNGGATIGSPAAAVPAAIAFPIVAALSLVEAALVALGAAIDAKLPPSPGATSGAMTTVAANIAALHLSIGALKTSVA